MRQLMLKAPSGTNWAFEEFQVMTGRRVLVASGTPVPLTSKAFDTLVVLIENRDRVVTKDELLRAVWSDVEVEEGNLTQQIFLLRKALGETAQQPRHIVTIPGHGYRFTARVSAIPDEPAAIAVPPSEVVSPPPVARRGATFVATVLVAVGVITLGLRWMPSEQPPVDFTKHITKVSEGGKVTFSAISRDGDYIAYIENEGDEHSLWLKRVGTEGKTAIVASQPLPMTFPSFSPNGEYLYFSRQSPRGPMSVLYRIPILGGLETALLEDVDSPARFSPDGREFVFLRGATAAGSAIVVAGAGGGSPRILATVAYPLRFSSPPDWSPDGKVVAAVVTDASSRSRSIVLFPLDGAGSRELYRTDSGMGGVRWLPDGSALLAVMSPGLERRVFGRVTGGAIWRIDYPSGHAERLTSGLANNDPCCLDIAANGAVANVINTLVSDLWIAPADRLDAIRQLTSDHPVIGRHSWLPDNDTLVYPDLSGRLNAVHKDGRPFSLPMPDGEAASQGVSACGAGSFVVFSTMPGRNIRRVTPDAGGIVKLTSGFNDFNPACSADGKWVWYVSREPESTAPSLWRVAIEGGKPEPMNLFGYYVLPSPTGRMIMYQTDSVEPGADRNRPDRWEIISSSGQKRLYKFDIAGDTNIGMMTKWAPDESGLDYVVTRDGVSNIRRQLLTGGPPVQITHFRAQRIFSFAWSPDGRWLSLAMGAARSDVALMSSEQ
jgi:DNA-binding winged helix-turn-helix (wHTH) protein/Tol biopolymer transport system component